LDKQCISVKDNIQTHVLRGSPRNVEFVPTIAGNAMYMNVKEYSTITPDNSAKIL